MSQEDIDRAVKDAERFAEEDKKQKDAVDTKNRAESLIFQSEKTLGEIGDKIPESETADVKAAIEKLKSAVNGGDTEAVEKSFYKISEKLYAQQAQAGGAEGFDPNAGAQGGDGTYYDANYEDHSNN